MSSILVLRQRNAVHMMTDAAGYDYPSGIMRTVDLRKCFSIPKLNAAVSCTGPATLPGYWSYRLPEVFETFEDIVTTSHAVLPGLFQDYADQIRDGDAMSTFYIIGWHREAARPAAYTCDMWTEDSTRIRQVLENGAAIGQATPVPFNLKEEIAAGTPLPPQRLLSAAGWRLEDNLDDVDPEIDLLHLMEVQRHEQIEGRYWVGGHALLTSIDRNGIKQRVVHTWGEDRVGGLIEPGPIDWKAWRASRVAAKANVDFSSLSRLQRQRMEKKAMKGTLR